MKGIHRTTPNTKLGRSMISPGKTHEPWKIPKDIAEHNRLVDERKAAKLEAKLHRKD